MSAEEAITRFLAKDIGRREFIKRLRAIGVTAGAAFSFAELLAGCQAATSYSPPTEPIALTKPELQVLEAIAGRILPTTDTPGAIEAGAAYYIDQALAEP